MVLIEPPRCCEPPWNGAHDLATLATTACRTWRWCRRTLIADGRSNHIAARNQGRDELRALQTQALTKPKELRNGFAMNHP